MSPSDVPPDEMGMDPSATDAFERMLSGSSADDEWRDVAGFVQELQEAVPSSGLPSEDLHVAAMVQTAHLLGLPKQRRKSMKRNASIVAKVLAPIAAVLTVFGGMAYAGALPRSVQNAVSHAAGTVGVTLPSDEDTQELPGENDDSQGDNDNQGEDTSKDDLVLPGGDQTDQNDQGDSSDDQGESSDGSVSSDDQGENDDSQGDNDNQGEDSQGDSTDQTSGDDQGDTTQSGGDQGDQGGDTQGDGSDQSSGDQQGGDNQD